MIENFEQHLLICNPDPSTEDFDECKKVVSEIRSSIMKVSSPRGMFNLSNDLVSIMGQRTAESGELGTLVHRVIERSNADWSSSGIDLYACVCAMLAVLQVMEKTGGPKRAALAVAIWSGCSFEQPMAVARLDALREEILDRSEEEAMSRALKLRQRENVDTQNTSEADTDSDQDASASIAALRRNSACDREDIAILRWLLADECEGFSQQFCEIDSALTATLAMGLELGTLLRAFPSAAHHQLGDRFVTECGVFSLDQLIESLGSDRERLAALCKKREVVEACPRVFPLMTALIGMRNPSGGAHKERSLKEWWGRALLESAAVSIGSRKQWS